MIEANKEHLNQVFFNMLEFFQILLVKFSKIIISIKPIYHITFLNLVVLRIYVSLFQIT